MTPPSAGPAQPSALDADAPLDTDAPAEWVGVVGRAILGIALLLGIAGDALLRTGPTGLGFPLWLTLVALGAVALVWRAGQRVPREARWWLATAVLLAAGLAWRSAPELQLLDLAAAFGAMAMAGVALSDGRSALLAARLRDTVWALWALVVRAVAGFLPLAVRELFAPESRARRAVHVRPIARAALIGGAVLFVFGSLLRGADPIFASLVALPELDVGLLVGHLVLIVFCAWMVAGWARGALLPDPARPRAPETLPVGLGMLDVTTALGTLTALFALFVLTQLGWFFGGEQFLRAQTGLSAAEYARRGFFQMVFVVALVVPLLLATRAALRPGRELARRHTALSLPIIALLGVMIVSAVLRLRLYVHYYGLTTDRFHALVFMGWLALVLGWLALTVLRDQGRPFVAGAAVSGLAVLAGLNVVAPDALVARVNVARAASAPPPAAARPALDLRHLASLSGEASEVAVRAVLARVAGEPGSALRTAGENERCRAAAILLDRWGPQSRVARRAEEEASWRTWNAGEREAMRVVSAHAAALRPLGRGCHGGHARSAD